MKLVKIGQVYLNFDQVRHVRDPGGAGSGAPLTIDFARGQALILHTQADSLRTWLAANATDALAPPVSTSPTAV